MGISERDFWAMLPREFMRRVDVHNEQQEHANKQAEATEEARFYNTLNAVGLAMTGKEWKWISPEEEPKDIEERWERAYARHLRRIHRHNGSGSQN